MKSLSHIEAILYALAGFTLWVVTDASLKLVSESNLPPYQIVAFLGFFGALTMILKAAPRGEIKKLWPKNPKTQFIRALLCLANNICCVIALKHLPLTMFYVIVFMSPMTISIVAAFFLKEKLNWAKGLALIIGFIGVITAINPFGADVRGNWIGYAAGIGAVISFSANIVWLRVMTQSESADSLAFFTGFIEAIAGLGFMLFYAMPITIEILFILVIAGFFNVVGNLFNFIALKNTTAAIVEQFHYTQIITGALLGYLIWHDVPTPHLILGAIIIIGSGLYIAAQARKFEKTAASSPHLP